jgi:hypothetical protein
LLSQNAALNARAAVAEASESDGLTYAKSTAVDLAYVHPAAKQKRLTIEKFERFRAEAIINAAAPKSQGVSTEVTTVERVQ